MIPLRVDRRLRHTPWVNMTLIAANVLVFVATYRQLLQMHAGGESTLEGMFEHHPVYRYFLHPYAPQWWQFFSYQFLHADIWHLTFNMLFLYIFGNSLEDRFGPVGYAFYYLAGGVVAGIGHVLTSDGPALGASGSVSAVTGAFLALFPLTHVLVLVPFFFFFFAEWPSFYLILFAFVRDVFSHFSGAEGVAYMAHISGNLYGFTIGVALLVTRIVPREMYDLVALLDRWRRRRQMRELAVSGRSPWGADAASTMGQKKLTPEQETLMQLRSAVQAAVRGHDGPRAAAVYEELLRLDPDQVLPRNTQMDLAAFAMGAGRHDLAAAAYEGFRKTYPTDESVHEVSLILGLVYLRYLGEPDRARPLLEQARDRHTDPQRRELAAHLLAEI